ncbi:MAG: hypothetical protein Q8R38_03545 [Candidatus Omnitrophota bacterium]|nr:hypothetical protein [Candidatus Omnitrophota bacterium]
MKVYINTVFDEIYSREAKEVVLPGDEGELSIMDFHQPIICRLVKGSIKVFSPQKKDIIHIVDGVAHMEGNVLKIMAEV